VLFCSFFTLLVVIPGFLYLNFADSSTKDDGGVHLQNKMVFGQLLNENLIVKNMPQILARSLEFEGMRARSQHELELLKKLKSDDRIAELLPRTVSKHNRNQNLKPILLILGHLLGHEGVDAAAFKANMDEIRRLSPYLV